MAASSNTLRPARGRYPAAITAMLAAYLPALSMAEGTSPAKALSEDFLMTEISLSLGSRRGWRHKHAKAAEAILLPLCDALPKTENGKLNIAASRYCLKRYFEERHGWFLHGLEPSRGSWNSSVAGLLQKNAAPAFVLGTVQNLLAGQSASGGVEGPGLSVGQLAVVAATVEHLIESDVVSRLQAGYASEGLISSRSLRQATDRNDPDSFPAVSEDLAASLVLRQLAPSAEAAALRGENLSEAQPVLDAGELKTIIREELAALAHETADADRSSSSHSFAGVRRIVKEATQRVQQSKQMQCIALRRKFEAVADKHTGTVRLASFYGSLGSLEPQGGSMDALREAGVLTSLHDEEPNVVVSNYLTSAAQCMSASSYHSICCRNECEAILASFEKTAGGPAADLQQVLGAVTTLNVSSWTAPAADLQARLQVLAAREKGGRVRLYSREFSQWLHYAFPLACPLPLGQEAAAKHPRTAEEWMLPYTAMSAPLKRPEEEIKAADVDDEEELLVFHTSQSFNGDLNGGRNRLAKLARVGVMAAAVLSASLGLVRAIRLALTDGQTDGCSASNAVALAKDSRERYHV